MRYRTPFLAATTALAVAAVNRLPSASARTVRLYCEAPAVRLVRRHAAA